MLGVFYPETGARELDRPLLGVLAPGVAAYVPSTDALAERGPLPPALLRGLGRRGGGLGKEPLQRGDNRLGLLVRGRLGHEFDPGPGRSALAVPSHRVNLDDGFRVEPRQSVPSGAFVATPRFV